MPASNYVPKVYFAGVKSITLSVPRALLRKVSSPKPLSASNFIASSAPCLFPRSLNFLATIRADKWRVFPGKRRAKAALRRTLLSSAFAVSVWTFHQQH